MAVETPVETPAEEPVAPASATPEPEPSPEYVSKSDYEAGLEAQEERIVARLKQSTGDKVKAAVSSEVADVVSAYDQAAEDLRPFLKEGADLEAIKRNAAIDKLLAQSASPESVPESETPSQVETPAPASVPPENQTEVAQLLEQHGLDGEEPELMEYAKANEGKPWYEVGQGFADLAKSIAARSAGDTAGVVPSQGQVAKEDLVKEFRTELDSIRNPTKQVPDGKGGFIVEPVMGRYGMKDLRQLQDKYVELGANIEDLDISPAQPNWEGHRVGDGPPPPH